MKSQATPSVAMDRILCTECMQYGLIIVVVIVIIIIVIIVIIMTRTSTEVKVGRLRRTY